MDHPVTERRNKMKTKKEKKLTGSCSLRCWFAKKEECKCICEGKNHQIGLAIVDKESKKRVEELKEKFKEYQKTRKLERKMGREGTSFKATAHKIMSRIVRGR